MTSMAAWVSAEGGEDFGPGGHTAKVVDIGDHAQENAP